MRAISSWNLEASVRSRNEERAIGRTRDLIEAGLSEPAGWRARLWGLCLWRWVREGVAAEMGGALGGLSATRVSDCGSRIAMGDAAMRSVEAVVALHRVGMMPANAASLAGVVVNRHQESRAAEVTVPHDVSAEKVGRGGAGRGRTASMTMTPPQPGQGSGRRGGTVSWTGSAATCGRSSSRRQTASLSAR